MKLQVVRSFICRFYICRRITIYCRFITLHRFFRFLICRLLLLFILFFFELKESILKVMEKYPTPVGLRHLYHVIEHYAISFSNIPPTFIKLAVSYYKIYFLFHIVRFDYSCDESNCIFYSPKNKNKK